MTEISPNFSILELGTTTGGVASTVLSSVSKLLDGVTKPIEYTFSSPNVAALTKAEAEHLQAFKAIIKFKVLDIKQNPANQGFENSTYDMIIISNTLGAVTNLTTTLDNTKKLLKPKGRLCMLRLTNPGLRLATILRCLPDWQR